MGILAGVGNVDPTFSYNYYYGVEFDTATAASAGTRIGKSELHVSLPIQSRMKRCILKDDGTVNYYLNDTDSTKKTTGAAADLSGADGQVMVEIPAHYRRFETEGTKQRAYISEYALPGFTLVPKMYISAFEATVDRTNSKLASVVNATAQYRGGDNSSTNDAGDATFLGKPATALSRTQFRTYARARGTNNTCWNCYTYEAHKTLYWLYLIEYNNRNCQADYNAALDANNYHQGGLGPGVTTLGSEWGTFNGYYPVIPCGATNSLGNNTGVVSYSMPASYGNGSVKVSVPSYRGIENPFGHLYKWTDGVNIAIQSAGDGNLSKIYICSSPANYQDSNYTNYDYVGDLSRTEGYMKEIIFGDKGDILPLSVGGSSTTYWADYFYTSIPSTGVSLRGLLFGGAASNGANAGFGYADTNFAPSFTNASIGSRLCYMCEAS